MKIKPELMEEFEKVFPQAAAVSASCKGYISHEMQRCVETKGKYFYLIRWESVEAHEVNFRQTPKRQQFRDLIGKILGRAAGRGAFRGDHEGSYLIHNRVNVPENEYG